MTIKGAIESRMLSPSGRRPRLHRYMHAWDAPYSSPAAAQLGGGEDEAELLAERVALQVPEQRRRHQ